MAQIRLKTPFPHSQRCGICQCSQTTQIQHCITGGGKLALKNDFSKKILQLIVEDITFCESLSLF